MTQLELACEKFCQLLTEQLDRIENMSSEKTDFSKKDVITVGIVDGDGIGPIIMRTATLALERYLQKILPPVR